MEGCKKAIAMEVVLETVVCYQSKPGSSQGPMVDGQVKTSKRVLCMEKYNQGPRAVKGSAIIRPQNDRKGPAFVLVISLWWGRRTRLF